MGTYEMILTVVFMSLAVMFLLWGGKACAQAMKAKDHVLRKNCRRKALILMALALMLCLCALYIIFRISGLMIPVFILGAVVVAYVSTSGMVANMRKH